MPTTIILGANEAHENLTCKPALWKPSGDSGFFSLGNVKELASAHEADTVERTVSEDGFVRVNDTQISRVKYAWDLTLDEVDAKLLEVITMGTQGATAQQAAATAPAGTASITSIQEGRWHDIGVQGLDTVVATVDAVTLVEGTDYEVDLDNGLIYFPGTADAAEGETCGLTFGNDAIDYETFTALDDPIFDGTAQLHVKNRKTGNPLYLISFTGNLIPMEWQTFTGGGEFGEYKVRLVADSKPTVKRRSAA